MKPVSLGGASALLTLRVTRREPRKGMGTARGATFYFGYFN
jgi:hypothetical protein